MVQVLASRRRFGRAVLFECSRKNLPCHPIAVLVVIVIGVYLVVLLTTYHSFLNGPPYHQEITSSHHHQETDGRANGTGGITRMDLVSLDGDGSRTKTRDRTVAFAISVTGCGSDPITEGAAVLKHSIHQASVHGTKGGMYDYEMLAIYHPAAEECTLPLEELGYTLMKRDVFVQVEDIKGDYLRSRISKNGCCGEKELIKLEAYTLTDFPIVVHLDLDVLVLKPLDEIFNWMTSPPLETPKSDSIMWPDLPWPTTINALFTMDYNMVNPGKKYKPVQGGFLVLRPSMMVYEEFRTIVTEGDFRERGGWGGEVGYVTTDHPVEYG